MDTTLVDTTDKTIPLPLGYIIDNTYKLLSIIGMGGMGCVYLALDINLLSHVAIKILYSSRSDERETNLQARFLQEARLMAAIKHKNILSAKRFGKIEEFNLSYFVTDAILLTDEEISNVCSLLKCGLPINKSLEATREIQLTNLSLEKILCGNKTLSEETVCKIARAIVSVLETIHNNKPQILHRDIKPDNLLFDKDGNIYLTDFGIAKVEKGYMFTRPNTTEPGLHPGTPTYASPEQIDGNIELTPATDYYSFGLLLYKTLTGGFPSTISKSLPIESSLSKKTTLLWNKLFNGLLEKNPSKRLIDSKQIYSIISQIEKNINKRTFWQKIKGSIKRFKYCLILLPLFLLVGLGVEYIYTPMQEEDKLDKKIDEIIENTIQFYDKEIEYYNEILSKTDRLPEGTNVLHITKDKNYLCDNVEYLDAYYDTIIFDGGTLTIHLTSIPMSQIEEHIRNEITPEKLRTKILNEFDQKEIPFVEIFEYLSFEDLNGTLENCTVEITENGGLINAYKYQLYEVLSFRSKIICNGESATLYLYGDRFGDDNRIHGARIFMRRENPLPTNLTIKEATPEDLKNLNYPFEIKETPILRKTAFPNIRIPENYIEEKN